MDADDFTSSEMSGLVEILGIKNPNQSELHLSEFCRSLDVEIDFGKLKIGLCDREEISSKVNLERLKNNPFEFDQIDIAEIFNL